MSGHLLDCIDFFCEGFIYSISSLPVTYFSDRFPVALWLVSSFRSTFAGSAWQGSRAGSRATGQPAGGRRNPRPLSGFVHRRLPATPNLVVL